MIYEILYTSVPRGLALGSSGFCTVKATRGIPMPVRQLLESLSSLRATGGTSAVCTSFLAATVAGHRWRIFSQIRPAPLDYSQRSNFLAHHIAIPCPLPSDFDPAYLLGQEGLFTTAFDGVVEELEPRVRLAAGQLPPAPCRTWERLTGDAGWAGAVAAKLEDRKPVHLISMDGAPALALIAEVLSLMPPRERADYSFSTLYSGLPAGVDCQLRAVAKGSPEHQSAVRGGGFVFELGPQSAPPPPSSLVAAARSGEPAWLISAGPPRLAPTDFNVGDTATIAGYGLAPVPAAVRPASVGWGAASASPPVTVLSTNASLHAPESGRWLTFAVSLALGLVLGGAAVAPFWWVERSDRITVQKKLTDVQTAKGKLQTAFDEINQKNAGKAAALNASLVAAEGKVTTLTAANVKSAAEITRQSAALSDFENGAKTLLVSADVPIDEHNLQPSLLQGLGDLTQYFNKMADLKRQRQDPETLLADSLAREAKLKSDLVAMQKAPPPPEQARMKVVYLASLLPHPTFLPNKDRRETKYQKILNPPEKVTGLKLIDPPDGLKLQLDRGTRIDWQLTHHGEPVGNFHYAAGDSFSELRFHWQTDNRSPLAPDLTEIWCALSRSTLQIETAGGKTDFPLGREFNDPGEKQAKPLMRGVPQET